MPDSVELKDTERYKNYFAAAYKKDSKAFRKEVDLHLHEQLNSADSTMRLFISPHSLIVMTIPLAAVLCIFFWACIWASVF